MERRVLAIIPARGGSKSIPRKNIKRMVGKPLIAWAIESAIESLAFARVVVATDDKEIADISGSYGADVPFLLPAELTQDDSSILDVIQHTLDWLKEHEEQEYEIAVLLEPTFPLRKSEHIVEGLALLEDGADSVVAVAPVSGHYNPHWQFTVKEDQSLEVFTGGHIKDIIPRRQMLPVTYTRNGGLYAFKTNLRANGKLSIYGEVVRAYIMGPEYTVDIDGPDDWALAERKMLEIHGAQTHT